MADLKAEYLQDLNGYYKMNDRLKPKFIVEYPRFIAESLEDGNRNKLSQIWKFYDHARRVQDRLNQKNQPLDVLAELNVLRPAAAYAYSRGTVTKEFEEFIDENVSRIKDKYGLNLFIEHFQAVIAYLPRGNQK